MTRRLDLLALIVVLTGAVAVVAGVLGAWREEEAAFALPFVASGVVGGLALVVFGLGVLRLQSARRAAVAAHHALVTRLNEEAAS